MSGEANSYELGRFDETQKPIRESTFLEKVTEERDSSTTQGEGLSNWTLLRNPQLAVLCFLRIAEPLAATSILSYLLFQVRYVSPGVSEAQIATYAGLLIGAKTFARVLTGVFWGMLADKQGRKPVLLIGLISAAIATVGYGFATNFSLAISWQIVLGATSNEIAITRTIAAELYPNAGPQTRSRALILPLLVSSPGMLFGPILGGFTSRRKGLGIFSDHPYALPNTIVAGWYAASAVLVFFFVRETKDLQVCPVPGSITHGRPTRRWLLSIFMPWKQTARYKTIPLEDEEDQQLSSASTTHAYESSTTPEPTSGLPERKSGFRQIWPLQITTVLTLTSHFVINGHISGFATLYAIFLSTPIHPSRGEKPGSSGEVDHNTSDHSIFIRGGLNLDPQSLGIFLTAATLCFAVAQTLLLPILLNAFGTIRLWKLAVLSFPVIYLLAPLPSLLTSDSSATLLSWAGISAIMVFFMMAHSAVIAPMVILINECVDDPSTRGTINAIGTSVGNLARSIFPVVVMTVYGIGLRHGFLAAAFWVLACAATIAIVTSQWVGKHLDERAVLKRRIEE